MTVTARQGAASCLTAGAALMGRGALVKGRTLQGAEQGLVGAIMLPATTCCMVALSPRC